MCMDKIQRNGHTYEYDSDFDVYRRVPEPITLKERYGWLVAILVLTIVAYACTVLN